MSTSGGLQYPGQPVTVRLSTPATQTKIILGTALLLLFGGVAAYGAITGDLEVENPVAGRIIAGCIALLFLGFGVPTALMLPAALRPRAIVVDPSGIQYVDPGGRAWACDWSELSRLRVETASRPTRTGIRSSVRLILRPAAPGFTYRHPSVSAFAARDGAGPGEFSMQLGPDLDIARQLDAALRAAGAPCYSGLTGTDVIIGPGGYS